MDIIDNFLNATKKDLESSGFMFRLSPLAQEKFIEFEQELRKAKGDNLDLSAVEFVKLLFIYSYYFLLSMQDIKKLKSKESLKDSDTAAKFENGQIAPDNSKILNKITHMAVHNAFPQKSEEQINEEITIDEKNMTNISDFIKDLVRELLEQKFYTSDEALSFSRLTDDNKNYFSTKLFLDVKKSFKNFVENGKCQEQVFPFVLVIFLDFLNNKGIEQGQKFFSEEVISFFYYIVFSYDDRVFLSFYSDMVMNKVFIDAIISHAVLQLNYGWFDDESRKNSFIQKQRENYPQFFCFSFVDEGRFIQILEIGKEDDSKRYEPLLKLYNLYFGSESAGSDELQKEYNVKEIFTKLLEKYKNAICEYPGFCFCFAYLIKYLRKNEIENIFGQKDIISFKQEWDKIELAKNRVHEKFGPIDKETFKFIWDSQTQKELEEDFKERSVLLQGIFYAQLYFVLNSVRGDEFAFEFNKAVWELCQTFHNSFIHPDYIEQLKKNTILNGLSNLLLGKDLFNEINIDCINNSEEVISVVYFLSRYYTDNLHAAIDFLNHVREKQKVVLKIVPDKFLTYTKEEAEKEKLQLEQNQKILKEQIDPGFTIGFHQTVSTIILQIPLSVYRRMTIKSFVETDKKYSIYYYQKNKNQTNYYRLDKKEDFRVTNKNHLENHYLYPDRNVFTHNTANYMIIENLLDEDKAENLLYALYDIKKFLNRLEYQTKEDIAKLDKIKKEKKEKGEPDLSGELYLAGIAYLQNEFNALLKKMWKVIIPHSFDDPWKEVFGKDEMRPEYKERLSNLDYNHDFGPSFLKMLNDFLVKVYFASPDFLKECPDRIFLYLIFQNFTLEKFREK